MQIPAGKSSRVQFDMHRLALTQSIPTYASRGFYGRNGIRDLLDETQPSALFADSHRADDMESGCNLYR